MTTSDHLRIFPNRTISPPKPKHYTTKHKYRPTTHQFIMKQVSIYKLALEI
uniref:Uncharacterized protein n=1 Tax=Arundo donax TaxID=35708 RepID=A0A0A9DH39_ARUDO